MGGGKLWTSKMQDSAALLYLLSFRHSHHVHDFDHISKSQWHQMVGKIESWVFWYVFTWSCSNFVRLLNTCTRYCILWCFYLLAVFKGRNKCVCCQFSSDSLLSIHSLRMVGWESWSLDEVNSREPMCNRRMFITYFPMLLFPWKSWGAFPEESKWWQMSHPSKYS